MRLFQTYISCTISINQYKLIFSLKHVITHALPRAQEGLADGEMPGLISFFLRLIREDGRRRRFAARGWHCTVSAESDDKVTRLLAAALDVASAPLDTAIAPLHAATTPQRWPAPPAQEMATPSPRSRLPYGFRLRLQRRLTSPASSSLCRSRTAPEGRSNRWPDAGRAA